MAETNTAEVNFKTAENKTTQLLKRTVFHWESQYGKILRTFAHLRAEKLRDPSCRQEGIHKKDALHICVVI